MLDESVVGVLFLFSGQFLNFVFLLHYVSFFYNAALLL